MRGTLNWSMLVVGIVVGTIADGAAVGAQEITLLAGGDVEWSRMVRAPNTYTLEHDREHDIPVRGTPGQRTWIDVPLLNVEANRQEIATLLGEDLDSPNAHHLAAIPYSIQAESDEALQRYPLQRVRELVQGADVAFANLEMPISDRARPTGAFVGSPAFADALAWAGFDLVSSANNHAFDGESVGLLDTMDHLAAAGVGQIGVGRDLELARSPLIVERDGIRLAFLGYARAINWIGTAGFAQPDQPGVLPLDPLLIKEDIARVRDDVDYVVLSFHWAIENAEDTHPDARTFAYEMVDAGADIILGHHPHVPRGVEVYNDSVIFYSLGNLIFGHNHDYWGDNYLARLTLEPDRISRVEIIPIAGEGQDMAQPYPLDGARARALLERVQTLTRDLDTELEIQGDLGVIAP
ncbi:MAG: CapA family protein [Dehalococcoidia bacterium]